MPELSSHAIEFHKAFFDYLKHITTLSTGSVILLAAFLEKLFVQPKWKFLVAVALVGFMLSVVASVIVHSMMIINFEPGEEPTDKETMALVTILIGAWLGFLIGIVSLTIFSIKNLF